MRVLILDDELDACVNIEFVLKKYFRAQVDDIQFAHSTSEAESLMHDTSFDLFFIDIEMPYETGIEFAFRKAGQMRHIIFVTSFDQYAVAAFRLNAIDYILKPIDEDIFIDAIQRMINLDFLLSKNDFENLVNEIENKNSSGRMVLRDRQQAIVVQVKDIIYLEAEKAYTKVVYDINKQNKTFLLSHNLSYYEEILEPYDFIRVHKSFVANKTQIIKFLYTDSILLLNNDHKIPVSRRRQQSLNKWL